MTHMIYAVGDLHGSVDLLRKAVQEIRRHAGASTFDVVFLGDYLDRGKDVRSTVELLIGLRHHFSMVCLRGNHEEMFHTADMERTERNLSFWLDNGGWETVDSYAECRSTLYPTDHIPTAHKLWISSRPLLFETATHVFVHAGVHPKRDMLDQTPNDLLWIRRRFLQASAKDFVDKRHIVHGHTPAWRGKPEASLPELLPHRSNLDTGAYATGLLTVGCFVGGRSGGPVDLISVL